MGFDGKEKWIAFRQFIQSTNRIHTSQQDSSCVLLFEGIFISDKKLNLQNITEWEHLNPNRRWLLPS